MMKLFCVLSLLFALGTTEIMAKKDFVIDNNVSDDLHKASRGALKETLGDELHEVVYATIQVLSVIGDLQVALSRRGINEIKRVKNAELQEKKGLLGSDDFFTDMSSMHLCIGETCKIMASMQKTVSSVLEKLIDNSHPFKRASRPELRSIVGVVRLSHHQLRTQMRVLKGVIHNVKKVTQVRNSAYEKLVTTSREMLVEQRDAMKKMCSKLQQDNLVKQV